MSERILQRFARAATMTTLLLATSTTQAEAGDWLFRAGGSMILPTNNNGLGLEVKEDTMLTFNGSYSVTTNIAVELLAALPFTHEIDVRATGANVGETKHLPPTLSVQWHFNPNGAYRPCSAVRLAAC